MSSITHKAIVVTTYDRARAEQALHAVPSTMSASGLVQSNVNGYWTIIVGPDGSKLGWANETVGARGRDEFINWLEQQRFEDGGSPFEWVEVEYGRDVPELGREPAVTRSSEDE